MRSGDARRFSRSFVGLGSKNDRIDGGLTGGQPATYGVARESAYSQGWQSEIFVRPLAIMDPLRGLPLYNGPHNG